MTDAVAIARSRRPRIRIVGANGNDLEELRRMLAPIEPEVEATPGLPDPSALSFGDAVALHIVDLRSSEGLDLVHSLRDHERNSRPSAPILVVTDREEVEDEVLRGYRIVGTLEAVVTPLRPEPFLRTATLLLELARRRSLGHRPS